MNEQLMNGETLINEGQALIASKVGVSAEKLGES